MPGRLVLHPSLRLIVGSCAASLLLACPLMEPQPTAPAGGVVSAAASVTLQLKGGTTGSVLLGGKVYKPGADGKLVVNRAQFAGAGTAGLILLVPGMQPQRVRADQGPITLEPAPTLGPTLTVSGGQPFGQGGVGLGFTPALLARPAAVSVAVYDVDANATALGMTVTVDGHLGAGSLPVTLDLGSWLEAGGQRAAFATKALAAANALAPDARAALAQTKGITVEGNRLTFTAQLGDEAVTQGAVSVEVDGMAALGVSLTLTVVSAANVEGLPTVVKPSLAPLGGLPKPDTVVGVNPGTTTTSILTNAASIVSDNGGGLLCRGGGALFSANVPLISDHGAAIISDHGGGAVPLDLVAGVVGNNGGSLVGKVKAPNLVAKYSLFAAFPVVEQPAIRVSLPYLQGSPTVMADATGSYRFDNLPKSGPNLVVVAKDSDTTLLTLCPAPGTGQVTADINPDTTAVAAEALVRLLKGCSNAPDFYPPGYADAVARVAALPSYDLAAYARLESKLYQPPAGTTAGTYTFGAPWANQLGCTYVTARQTVQANDPSQHLVASGLPAGAHVGFDCDTNTTFNGINWIDYTGDPAYGGNGRLLISMPGYAGPFPRGQILTLPAAGDVYVSYQDGPGTYGNNLGAINTRFDVDLCP